MKRIASIGIATTMVAATLTGALAADLKSLPAPFIENGKTDVQIVIGAVADTADVIGAVDIATGLIEIKQSVVAIPGQTSTSVEDGIKIAQSGNPLNLNEGLPTAFGSGATIDESDLPTLLADGVLVDDDDSEEYDYTQEMYLNTSVKPQFDRAVESDWEMPQLYLDLDTNAAAIWNYSLEFTGDSVNVTLLEDSETIEMLGKVFTFSPSIGVDEELVLYGSDKTDLLTLNEPKTYVIDGKSYSVTIVSGNTNTDSVVIRVNDQQKTVEQGDTETIGGLEIYAKDVFVTDVPVLSAAATLFVGSSEITLPAPVGTLAWTEVDVDGEAINGLEAWVEGDNGEIESINFRYVPSDLSDDVEGFDETEYLMAGDTLLDPLFGTLEVSFVGPTSELMDEETKSHVRVEGTDDGVDVTFTNNEGNEVSFTALRYNAGTNSLNWAYNGTERPGFVNVVTNVPKDAIFAATEGSGDDKTTHLFEVVSFKTEDTVDKVRIQNLMTGDQSDYSDGDKLVGSITISGVSKASENFDLTGSSEPTKLYLNGGASYLEFLANSSVTPYNVSINLTEADASDTTLSEFGITFDYDSDDDVQVTVTAGGTYENPTDKDSDFQYYLTDYGSHAVVEIDDDKAADFYVPLSEDEEVTYEVFFAPVGAQATVVGGGSSVTTETVTTIPVGARILDSALGSIDSAKTNLIVVGGPCVNSAARELLKLPMVAPAGENCAAGFTPDTARIELFTMTNGKVALLVAGYSAEDTQAASLAIARRDPALMGQSALLEVKSATEYTVKNN